MLPITSAQRLHPESAFPLRLALQFHPDFFFGGGSLVVNAR